MLTITCRWLLTWLVPSICHTCLILLLKSSSQTIVATAIPRITDEFQSIDQVGWYASAFFLTLATFQSNWGKLYKYNNLKIAFLASGVIFEVGSLICGKPMTSATPQSK